MAAYVLSNVCKDSSKPHWNAIPVGRHKRDVVIGVLKTRMQTGDKKEHGIYYFLLK